MKLLLHSCCAPCSTAVIDCLKDEHELTIYYYNPNIDTEEEYQHRLTEQKRYCQNLGIKVIEEEHLKNDFISKIKGLEECREGGARCAVCFKLRLEKTADKAKELGFEGFATTLTVSPHKNSTVINAIGKEVENQKEIYFLDGNFKKKDGYKKSIILSKEFGLYRQNYCGCEFSKKEREN